MPAPSSPQGLDLVRREWCTLSKDTGKFVLDRILSGEAREAVVAGIHDHLEALATSMRAGEVEVPRYVITKGLNKAPHEYPDAKSQPHVQVGGLVWVVLGERREKDRWGWGGVGWGGMCGREGA